MAEPMHALVNYSSAPGSVELREVPVPEIGDEDVLLRVEAVGVCGSDLHQWEGTHSWPVNYPCTLGHEFGGTVARVGARVRGFPEGARVVSETAAVVDRDSPYTRTGQYNLDPSRLGFGYGVDGAMARYVRVPARCLHHVPDGLPFERACLAEPCAVAYNTVCVNGRVRPGDHVLVVGPGPIGLLCALMARLSGAGHLVVAGLPRDTHRLEVARRIGADAALGEGVREHVSGLGDGLGVDVVVDASGASAALDLALDVVRPAGQILKVGWGPRPLGFSLDRLVQKNVSLQGSFSHTWAVWERVLRMLATGQLDPAPLVAAPRPLDRWHDAFSAMHEGDEIKAILQP